MNRKILLAAAAFFLSYIAVAQTGGALQFYGADHPYIQYTGRIDYTNPGLPRFWQPGVYFTIRFTGTQCEVILNDEVLWGKNQNYLELVVDGKAIRLQTKAKRDTIRVKDLADEMHTLTICKITEANIGYLELAGIRCAKMEVPPPRPVRKIEFIGNSITCGASSDISVVPCGKGVWHDQHNAYLSYGAITARELNAQYHLSAVSGIGLMHSCCNLDILMPQVFDKVNMRNDTIRWDFTKYQPDVVTVCLGQNDGIQDSTAFCTNYISFVKTLRQYYPEAMIICLTSPMADATLSAFMKKTLTAIVKNLRDAGEKKIDSYFFTKQYAHGCDYHPDIRDHREIAKELTGFLAQKMNWQ